MANKSDRYRRFKEAMEASKRTQDILIKALTEVIGTGKELKTLAMQMSSSNKVDASVQTDTVILKDKDVQTVKNEVFEIFTQTSDVRVVNKNVQTYSERSEEKSKPQEIAKLCFNCHSTTHNYGECPFQTLHSFCFQCGMSEVTVKDCPRCTPSWKEQNPNFSGVSDYRGNRYRKRHRGSPFSRPTGSRPTLPEWKRRL